MKEAIHKLGDKPSKLFFAASDSLAIGALRALKKLESACTRPRVSPSFLLTTLAWQAWVYHSHTGVPSIQEMEICGMDILSKEVLHDSQNLA